MALILRLADSGAAIGGIKDAGRLRCVNRCKLMAGSPAVNRLRLGAGQPTASSALVWVMKTPALGLEPDPPDIARVIVILK